MSRRAKLIWGIVIFWLAVLIVLGVVYGIHGQKNSSFKIEDEFKLVPYVDLGTMSINRAVVYEMLAALLTITTMWWVARRMEMRPNRVQTAVEFTYSLMRDNITRGNMPDRIAAKWFPFCGGLFLFIEYANLIGYLPLPTNTLEPVSIFGVNVPSFALYAATANISMPMILSIVVFIVFIAEGIRVKGLKAYLKSLIPRGVHGPMVALIGPLEIISIFMRIVSLTIRLYANLLAGHMILLFMAGGLAVILGLSFLGWFTMPFAVIVYIFELGLIATLQAFIFATLAAIYVGDAVAEH